MRFSLLICIICFVAPVATSIPPRNQDASAENAFRHPSTHTVSQAGTPTPPFAPTSLYQQAAIQGFTILINPEVLQHPAAAREIRKELNLQLTAITHAVPVRPLLALQKVRIWVEWNKREQGAAEFHSSVEWLKQNGYNPDKAGCVEVSNLRNFVQWSRIRQPWMLLHELAHAYHHRVLGDEYASIQAAYQHAVTQKLYQWVTYGGGGHRKAYALTNAKEYFAELSEAYFGKNDFYPFTRADLRHYDPVGDRLMHTVWGNPRNADRASAD